MSQTANAIASESNLRHELHERLLATLDLSAASRLGRDALVERCRSKVEELIDQSGRAPSAADRARIVQGVLDDVFGYGPLEPLFADPAVSDVLVSGPDRVWVERGGRLEESTIRFRDTAHVMQVMQRIVRNAGRRIDDRNPMVDARLPDGSRVHAIIPPLALDGPQLSIRRFPPRGLGLERLVELGSMAPETARLLESAVAGRLNVIFSGGAGVGKTTLLNAASAAIGAGERVITIEDAAELRLEGRHVIRLETRMANVEGIGAIGASELLRNALRMRPDRIIVGECRGGEAFDMLQAMNTGHEGSMTTLHANSARDALHRLESMLAMGGFGVPVAVLRGYIGSVVDLVVHLSRLPDGRRVVSEVVEVHEATEGQSELQIEMLHRFDLKAVRDGRVEGAFEATGATPRVLGRLKARGFELPAAVFARGPLGTRGAGR
ncbi:MAG: CpaF family protein [bacterium]